MYQKSKLEEYEYYSLPNILGERSTLPISIRIILESLIRNCDGKKITKQDVERLAKYNAKNPDTADIPFSVSRVLLQDFTGVPLLVDLAAMREKVEDPKMIEPLVPVDLVIDHSVQVDKSRSQDAFLYNLKTEFERNKERYEFLKWGQETFKTFKVIPPGIGIVHQVNLEYLATVITEKNGLLYFDTLVGTDSHTTMINGLGVIGWGVGGIEAEAAMLGQPISIQTPEVIGVYLENTLQSGVTATDLTLRVTELLRKENVVGKFVEFFGPGVTSLTVADRATIANMAPEYGATMGFFPIDEKTLSYLLLTGRDKKHIDLVEKYLNAQELFGIPQKGEINYTKVIELDLSSIKPSVAGPKRPQDRILISDLKTTFKKLLQEKISNGGYEKSDKDLECKIEIEPTVEAETPMDSGGSTSDITPESIWSEQEMLTNRPITTPNEKSAETHLFHGSLTHGSIVIAAITSCTNTSNPYVMIAAGLLAKKAIEKGLKINPLIKTSLAPGSRVVTDYLDKTQLQPYLDQLGFQLVAYGCTTCIGNSGPLDPKIEKSILDNDLITASVLSGNRNFEARIHSSVKSNFLMSPPLVIAYAIAGRIDIDLTKEPLANGVFLKDIWPDPKEINETIEKNITPEMFHKRYSSIFEDNPIWKKVQSKKGEKYPWDEMSTYIRNPPFFNDTSSSTFSNMRPLLLLGDSVTTDHISPAGAIDPKSPAGKYLIENNIAPKDFNSYGSRRGNHEVMMRGTFANGRIKNQMTNGKEGGFTYFVPTKEILPIYDAAMEYKKLNTPLIIFAGKDYGMGSSRDWAAKGTALLGVKAVVCQSFERIHRSNLIGMGVLPLLFPKDVSLESLNIQGTDTFNLELEKITPQGKANLSFKGQKIELTIAINTPIEAEYFLNQGILPFVLKQLKKK